MPHTLETTFIENYLPNVVSMGFNVLISGFITLLLLLLLPPPQLLLLQPLLLVQIHDVILHNICRGPWCASNLSIFLQEGESLQANAMQNIFLKQILKSHNMTSNAFLSLFSLLTQVIDLATLQLVRSMAWRSSSSGRFRVNLRRLGVIHVFFSCKCFLNLF